MATREAISGIEIVGCSQQQCDQLQQWLVHPPAALYKFCLLGFLEPSLRLQLSVLQHLKELELDEVELQAVAADGSVLTVADLLPRLQQCTKLTFHVREDPRLTAAGALFQAMPALQDLEVDYHTIPVSLSSLPTTLRRLCLTNVGEALDSTNAAGICQLTGLRVLEAEAYGFDTSEDARGTSEKCNSEVSMLALRTRTLLWGAHATRQMHRALRETVPTV